MGVLPGHIAKFKRQSLEYFKIVDAVLVLADARFPMISFDILSKWISNRKPIIGVMCKTDLADPTMTAIWKHDLKSRSIPIVTCTIHNKKCVRKIVTFVKNNCHKKNPKGPIKIMIIGLPNAGKSTLINHINKRSVAKAENRPGVTKSIQWINVSHDLVVLDTPGVLMDRPLMDTYLNELKLIGAISYSQSEKMDLVDALFKYIQAGYDQLLDKGDEYHERYDSYDWLSDTAKKLNYVQQGGELDVERTANTILQKFLSGRLGRLSFDSAKIKS